MSTNNPNDFRQELYGRLYRAYLEARKGKRKTHDEHRFELNDIENLENLCNSIINRTYRPSRGIAFLISRPVRREIFAAPFRDRIVHHFLYNVSAEWWDRRFIPDSYSCRIGKGTLYGQQRLQKHLRQTTNNFTEPAFAVKLDIQGYFMSLSRQKLYERICWGLNRQFAGHYGPLYHTVKFLWKQIIFDDPIRGVRIRGNKSDWHDLPSTKSLFTQPESYGIVIGNLTSQLLSNIYLDQLDRYVVHTLGYKHYGRYVDDFYIIVPISQKSQLLKDIHAIEIFLKGLGLTLHPRKRYAQNVKKGVPFVGAIVHTGYMTPTPRVKKRTKQAFLKYATGQTHGNQDSVVSYLGHLCHMNSKKFLKTLFDEFGWDFGDN